MNGGRSDRQGYEKTNYEIHVAKIRDIKGTVDCQAPRPHPLGVKVNTDEKRRRAAIEVDNRQILERLGTNFQLKMIDNEIRESTAVHSKFRKVMLKNKTKMDLQKLTNENQQMLKRIQGAAPAYSQSDWLAHSKKTEIHKRRMSAYPEFYVKLDRDSLPMTEKSLRRKSVGNFTVDFSLLPQDVLVPSRNTPPRGTLRVDSARSTGMAPTHMTIPVFSRISSGEKYLPILPNGNLRSMKNQ